MPISSSFSLLSQAICANSLQMSHSICTRPDKPYTRLSHGVCSMIANDWVAHVQNGSLGVGITITVLQSVTSNPALISTDKRQPICFPPTGK
jgi:hypothetical protein